MKPVVVLPQEAAGSFLPAVFFFASSPADRDRTRKKQKKSRSKSAAVLAFHLFCLSTDYLLDALSLAMLLLIRFC
jgi:hypothetical protein